VLRRALRKGTVNSAFTVVLCGSSYKNKGVQQVLDAVVDYMPARRTFAPSINGRRATARPSRAQVLGRRAFLGAGL